MFDFILCLFITPIDRCVKKILYIIRFCISEMIHVTVTMLLVFRQSRHLARTYGRTLNVSPLRTKTPVELTITKTNDLENKMIKIQCFEFEDIAEIQIRVFDQSIQRSLFHSLNNSLLCFSFLNADCVQMYKALKRHH